MENHRERILKSAMELILKKSIPEISTREVVKKAGVNISQLHYYFKTKNELFTKAICESTAEILCAWKEKSLDFNKPEISHFKKYIGFVIEAIYLYPSVSKSIIYLTIQGEDIDSFSFNFKEDLSTLISSIYSYDPLTLNQRIHLLSQLIISLRVAPERIFSDFELDFSLKEDRERYRDTIIRAILPELEVI